MAEFSEEKIHDRLIIGRTSRYAQKTWYYAIEKKTNWNYTIRADEWVK